METIDIAIIVLGIVVLGAAVTGAVTYEPDSRGERFDVKWVTDTKDLDPQTGSVGPSGGEETFTFDVRLRNVTKATFTVTVEAPSGHLSSDSITATLETPLGNTTERSTTLSSGAGQATVEVEEQVAEVPTVATVRAEDEAGALATLSEEHADDAGTGNWTVTVEVDHGGTGISGSHDITVESEVGFYGAEVSLASPDLRGN